MTSRHTGLKRWLQTGFSGPVLYLMVLLLSTAASAVPAGCIPASATESDAALPGCRHSVSEVENEIPPVAILVPGYRPVSGELDELAATLAARGFQVLRFNYDWNDRLDRSADRLVRFVREATPGNSTVTVIAFSMGGLVARRSMVIERATSLAHDPIKVWLITIAAPFGGYISANITTFLPSVMLGAHRSYLDMGSRSAFILKPGSLGDNISHIIIETNELGQVRCKQPGCNLQTNGATTSDTVALLRNQLNPAVRGDARVTAIQRAIAGHVGILHSTAPPILDALTRQLLDGQKLEPFTLRANTAPVETSSD